MKKGSNVYTTKRFLYSSEWNITFCRMGRKRYIPIYIYWWRGWRTHCWIRFHQRVCMWLFFFNEKWLIVSKYSSHNRVFCIWNIPSWHYWILGNGYENSTIRKACGRESIWMVYERLLDSYCTPEIRYRNLMERCPNLKEVVPLKSIASFLGVTPETISRIRRKLEI